MPERRKGMGSLIARVAGNIALVLLSAAIMFEIMSAAVISLKIIPANKPSYILPTFQPFWVIENPYFGVWHTPNARHVHVTACYQLVYESNSYGARDQERPKQGDAPRTLVLGDSFIEGFGLAREDRLTERLEAATGVPHLNFGTSGGFGPTQYLQLYTYLAKDFSHDEVLVGLLPDNDFLDNDPVHLELTHEPSYRPVFVRDADGAGYKLQFNNPDGLGTPERKKRSAFHRGLRNILRNFTFSANAIDYFGAMAGVWFGDSLLAENAERGYSGYYDATPDQIENVKYALSEFVKQAGSRRVRIVVIPRLSDILRYSEKGPASLASQFAGIAEVVDLLPVFATYPNPEKLYNDCDRHWSAEGVRVAVEALQ